MSGPRTIAWRLVAAAGLSTLVAVGVFWAATLVLVGRELHGSLDSGLKARALGVAQLAVFDPAVLNDPGALEGPVSGRQIAVEVLDARGRILARSLTLGASLLPQDRLVLAVLRRGRAGYEDIRLGPRQFRLYAAPIADASGPASGGAVLVASATGDIAHTIHHLGLLLGLSGLAIALLGLTIVVTLTARATSPLRRLVVSAREIRRTADPSQRLPPTARRDELGQLTEVLNEMLGSLERARDNERRFLADASHELRTPVTSLAGNIDYVVRHGADPDVLADLRADVERIARLVDDLLVLERHEAGGAEHTPVALDELVRATLAEREDDRVRGVELQAALVLGDEAALSRALNNLLENALLHGPLQGVVEVRVTTDQAGWARLTVSDAGPGPSAAERERVFERFWRGAGAAGRPGSGLGLSIVATIAGRHGGSAELAGSAFTLVLPLFTPH